MRELKRKSPDKKCVLEQEQLHADGKIYVYDPTLQKVVENANAPDRNRRRYLDNYFLPLIKSSVSL